MTTDFSDSSHFTDSTDLFSESSDYFSQTENSDLPTVFDESTFASDFISTDFVTGSTFFSSEINITSDFYTKEFNDLSTDSTNFSSDFLITTIEESTHVSKNFNEFIDNTKINDDIYISSFTIKDSTVFDYDLSSRYTIPNFSTIYDESTFSMNYTTDNSDITDSV
ncbi:unnamed protein product [Brachionus calyciflorus]|uniref:Uncharacterized protein n=1 Tax=Brachionus calyciflorus TaxID=104777 RepID=A0A813SX16_9BILA|nr:unnamed protein product [Brachionus calyciflorus]